jgi:hypothetical protein
VLYAVLVLVVAMFMANGVVCAFIGGGWVLFGRPGGGNTAWFLIVALAWPLLVAIGLAG